MRERDVEKALTRAVKQTGGVALKWVSPGFNGAPDRIVIGPGGRVVFVEVKAPGGEPRPVQRAAIATLRRLGCAVFVIDHPDQIEGVLDAVSPA